jgi:undecaprenyl-diphosphatase
VNLLAAAALGVVQGVTEFLPVSSSAHLILARAFFGWDADAFGVPFDVACHVGTLLATVVFFRTDLAAMVRALPRALGREPGPAGRRLRLIAIGTIPIVIVGLLFAHWIESSTRTPLVAATALLLGGGVLLAVERVGSQRRDEAALSAGGAFAIGVAQCAALVPGVSRSGSTIAMGLALGLKRAAAARFTFLLSIPAILAAAAREGLVLRHTSIARDDFALFGVGLLTSALVGYLAIRFFIQYLGAHRLDAFAWYRIALALGTFVWLAAR